MCHVPSHSDTDKMGRPLVAAGPQAAAYFAYGYAGQPVVCREVKERAQYLLPSAGSCEQAPVARAGQEASSPGEQMHMQPQ